MGKGPIQYITFGGVSISTEEYLKQKPRLEEVFKEQIEKDKSKQKKQEETPVPTVENIYHSDIEVVEPIQHQEEIESVSENNEIETKTEIEKPKKKAKWGK